MRGPHYIHCLCDLGPVHAFRGGFMLLRGNTRFASSRLRSDRRLSHFRRDGSSQHQAPRPSFVRHVGAIDATASRRGRTPGYRPIITGWLR